MVVLLIKGENDVISDMSYVIQQNRRLVFAYDSVVALSVVRHIAATQLTVHGSMYSGGKDSAMS